LARAVSNLDSEAFASLTRAMNALANDTARKPGDSARTSGRREWFADQANRTQQPAQMEYFHCTNAAAIE
jgi:hypothetical protein